MTKHAVKSMFFLSIVSILFVALILVTGDPVAVLLGYSMFVLALMTYAVKEAIHA